MNFFIQAFTNPLGKDTITMVYGKSRRVAQSQSTEPAAAACSTEELAGPASQIDTVLGRQAQTGKHWLIVSRFVFSDIALACLVWYLASTVQGVWGRGDLSEIAVVGNVSNVLVWVGLRALLGLYPGYGLDQAEELRRQTYALASTLAIVSISALVFQIGDSLSRLLLVFGFLSLLVLAPLVRHLVKRGLMRAGVWGKPVIILGAGKAGARLVRALRREWHLGYRPVAVFDSILAPVGGVLEGLPYRGTMTDAANLARKQDIDTAVFAMPHARRHYLIEFVNQAKLSFRYVIVIPNLAGVANSAATAKNLAGTFGVEVRQNLLNPWVLRAKRALDLVATVVGGALISVLILALVLLIWLESGRPIIYNDRRVGQGGRLFSCMKFRTMVPDAENKLQQMLKEDAELREEYSKYHKLRNDPRVTRVGRFLRKTSLDELPQLWNVLRGEMSLVGPRPYLPRETEKVGSVQSEILRVPPGITGPWQVAGRSQASFDERVRMDAHYIHDWSVWLDLVILARTVATVVFGRGAF